MVDKEPLEIKIFKSTKKTAMIFNSSDYDLMIDNHVYSLIKSNPVFGKISLKKLISQIDYEK